MSDTRLYCADCDACYEAGTWSCLECCGPLTQFDPLPIHFSVATGQPSFTPSLPTYSEGCLFRKQAGL
jgi:hypothetical protein